MIRGVSVESYIAWSIGPAGLRSDASEAFLPIEPLNVLTHGADTQGWIRVDRFISWYAALLTRIRAEAAGVNSKALPLGQVGANTAMYRLIEQPAKYLTDPKQGVLTFGKG